MKIVVDAFGGDNSPRAQIAGAVEFLKEQKGADIIFTGDKAKIESALSEFKYDESRVFIEHAPDVISNDESPTAAIRAKKIRRLFGLSICLNRTTILKVC